MADRMDEKGTTFCATPPDVAATRRQWLLETVNGVQLLAAHSVGASVGDQESRMKEIVQRLPSPVTPCERLLLRSMLWESAARLGDAVHRSAHATYRTKCTLKHESILLQSFSETTADPREAFERWTTTFFREFRNVHPPSKVERVALMIRERHDRPLDIVSLAAKVQLTPGSLRRAFQMTFGRTPKEYQSDLRVLSALERIGSEKVDAVALEVGYRSKKNFYRMFKSLTGLTPSAFRQLPKHEQHSVIFRARSAFELCVVRTFRSAVSGEPKGSHYSVSKSVLALAK
jgi:AraC-like DNA-binding protein